MKYSEAKSKVSKRRVCFDGQFYTVKMKPNEKLKSESETMWHRTFPGGEFALMIGSLEARLPK